MQIQINTDTNIEGTEQLATWVKGVVTTALGHRSDRLSRVEVHLSDENGAKSGTDDKRCMLEARVKGRQPIAVTHHGATLDEAVDGAADKLNNALDHDLERHERP